MTFEDDVDATGRYKSNPYTQDVSRAKDNRTFQQSPLLRVDHEDPALHYIGEGLPIPGESEATWAGRFTDVGTSPIPARADHSHDTLSRYTVNEQTAAGQTCAPGQTLIQHNVFFSEDWHAPASQTLLIIPQRGIYGINFNYKVDRGGGGIFTGEANILFFYLGGTFSRMVDRDTMTNIPGTYACTAGDTIRYGDTEINAGTSTLEVAYQHNDVVNHFMIVNNLFVWRLGDL